LAVLFAVAFMIVELVGGVIANSLAIMTDAAHLLSDVAGFLISIVAIWFGTMDATDKLSYGFHRAEVIGAVLSVALIWFLTGILVYEAVNRIIDLTSPNSTTHTDGKTMTIVAVCGLAVNLCLMKILGHSHGGHGGGGHGHSHGPSAPAKSSPRASSGYQALDSAQSHDHAHEGTQDHGHAHSGDVHDDHGDQADHGHSHEGGGHGGHGEHAEDSGGHGGHGDSENINVRAAYVHALGDLIQSLGVCVAGGLIWYDEKYQLADPCVTILFSFLVMWTTWGIIKSSVRVLMEGTPEAINPAEIEEDLRQVKDVLTVHDLHIWSLTMGKPSLSVHLTVSDHTGSVLHNAQRLLRTKYNIDHVTIQVEKEGSANYDCEPCENGNANSNSQ